MRKNIGVFRGKHKDKEEWVQGNYLCLHQPDDTDLHIIVDERRRTQAMHWKRLKSIRTK